MKRMDAHVKALEFEYPVSGDGIIRFTWSNVHSTWTNKDLLFRITKTSKAAEEAAAAQAAAAAAATGDAGAGGGGAGGAAAAGDASAATATATAPPPTADVAKSAAN